MNSGPTVTEQGSDWLGCSLWAGPIKTKHTFFPGSIVFVSSSQKGSAHFLIVVSVHILYIQHVHRYGEHTKRGQSEIELAIRIQGNY